MNNAERRKVEATVAALDRAMGDTSEVVKLRLDEVEVRDGASPTLCLCLWFVWQRCCAHAMNGLD